MDSQTLKRCSKCKEEKPSTLEYFGPHKLTRDGLDSWCRECHRARDRQRTKEQRRADSARYREAHCEECIERTKAWRANNPDYHKNKAIEWRETHHNEYVEYYRRYAREHPGAAREYYRQNPDKALARSHRYRARKRGLPDTFTAEDWAFALDYFNGCCAVCGRPLMDLLGTHTAAMDHWIPVNSPDCPGTVATNMVPLCQGKNGCNNSKADRNPEDFLVSALGKRKASKKIEEINRYFRAVEEKQ